MAEIVLPPADLPVQSNPHPSSGTRTIREAFQDDEAGAAARARLAVRFREPLIRLFIFRRESPQAAEELAQEFVTYFFIEPRPAQRRPPTFRFQLWQHQGKFDQYVHRSAVNFRKDAMRKKTREPRTYELSEVDPGIDSAADRQFFKAVALAQWTEIVEEFRMTYTSEGKRDLFEQFLSQISNDPDRVKYAEIAAAETARGRAVEPGNLRVQCARLKAQLQARLLELLRDEGGGDDSTALAEFWNLIDSP